MLDLDRTGPFVQYFELALLALSLLFFTNVLYFPCLCLTTFLATYACVSHICMFFMWIFLVKLLDTWFCLGAISWQLVVSHLFVNCLYGKDWLIFYLAVYNIYWSNAIKWPRQGLGSDVHNITFFIKMRLFPVLSLITNINCNFT